MEHCPALLVELAEHGRLLGMLDGVQERIRLRPDQDRDLVRQLLQAHRDVRTVNERRSSEIDSMHRIPSIERCVIRSAGMPTS